MKQVHLTHIILRVFLTIVLLSPAGCSAISTWMADQAHQKGQALEAQGQADQAIERYTKAIDANPLLAGAFFQRGKLYYSQGQLDLALADLEQTGALDAQNAEAPYLCAKIYLEQANPGKALGHLDQTINLDPQNADARYRRALIYLEQDEAQKAHADLDQAIALEIPETDAYYQRGRLLAEAKAWKAAVADFDQAIRLNDQLSAAYYQRALAYIALEKPETAIKDLSQAIQLEAGMAPAYSQRAHLYLASGETDKAFADFDQVIQLDEQNADAFYQRGLLQLQKKELQKALDDLSQALELDAGLVGAYFQRGEIYSQQGDLELAVNDFNQVVKLQGDYPQIYEKRSLALVDLGNYAAAIADLDRVVAQQPEEVAPLFLRGYAKFQSDDLDGAVDDFMEVSKIHSSKAAGYKNGPAYLNIGLALARKKEYRRAIDWLGRSIKAEPTAIAYHARGDINFELKDWGAAKEDYQQALDLDTNGQIAILNLEMAQVNFLFGEFQQAIDYTQEFLDAQPESDLSGAVQAWIAQVQAELDGESTLGLEKLAWISDDLSPSFEREVFSEPQFEKIYRKNPEFYTARYLESLAFFGTEKGEDAILVAAFRLGDEQAQLDFAQSMIDAMVTIMRNDKFTSLNPTGVGSVNFGYCDPSREQEVCTLTFLRGFVVVQVTLAYQGEKPTFTIENLGKLMDERVIQTLLAGLPFESGLQDLMQIAPVR
ncbi:MAG: tetratricopeptide repeat protein [Chloroflexota bacterium]